MKCPNCGYEIEKPNRKTCPLCGHKLTKLNRVPKIEIDIPQESNTEEMIISMPEEPEKQTIQTTDNPSDQVECPRCGKKVAADVNFCPHCGHNMHESQEEGGMPEEPISEEPVVTDDEIETPFELSEDIGDKQDDQKEQIADSDDLLEGNIQEDDSEYIENGSYQPYQEEEDSQFRNEDENQHSVKSLWWPVMFAFIISVFLGVYLYLIAS